MLHRAAYTPGKVIAWNAIRAERARLWPNRKKPESHPERWTGRSLHEDAKAADDFGGYGVRDCYDGRFAELCWSTHGSGLAGVRCIPEDHFPAIVAFAFQDSARLGTLASELTLRYFDKPDVILEARFREREKERAPLAVARVGEAKIWLNLSHFIAIGLHLPNPASTLCPNSIPCASSAIS